MKVLIASDHAGYALKQILLKKFPHFQDLGPFAEASVDYPDFANLVASQVNQDPSMTHGILICGSGQGMCMRANKFSNVKAALCFTENQAELARLHNDANILCLGSRVTDSELSILITLKFFSTPFEGGRHQSRVQKLIAPAT